MVMKSDMGSNGAFNGCSINTYTRIIINSFIEKTSIFTADMMNTARLISDKNYILDKEGF